MIYKCRRCEHEEARGCLPTVTCGLYLMFLMGCTAGLVSFAARTLHNEIPAANPAHETAGFGWWNLLLVPLGLVVALIVLFLCALLLNYTLELIEYIAYCARKCPKCGARRWSWGFTRGFGL